MVKSQDTSSSLLKKRGLDKTKEKVKNLPHNPGIYIFRDKKGKILYIGKATSLKNRVGSYFVGAHDTKTEKLISQIDKINTKETETVLEALILEANLIKKYRPKYNIQQKDDKSFSYFVITKEDFPRVLILRGTELKKLQATSYKLQASFGPYTSKKQMITALRIIRKIFPFHALKQKSEKGCLDHQIGKCPGPYAGKITKQDYNKNIRGIKMILEGKKNDLIKKMEVEMKKLAKSQDFEKATSFRDKIFALQHIQDIALISDDRKIQIPNSKFQIPRIEAYDISNISGRFAVGSMVVFKGNKPNKQEYRRFKIKSVKEINDVAMMKEVLERRIKNNWPIPNLILLDGGKGHLNAGTEILKKHNLKIPVVAIAKGPTRKISNYQFLISNQFPKNKFPKEIKDILKDRNLIDYIMSEAHRFAIQYHRKLRKS